MIEIRNVSASYGKDIVFSNLDLSIKKQAFFGIVGPSGVGKSTLLRIIAGLHTPDSGSVMINNKYLVNNDKKINKKEKLLITQDIGYIFQDFALFDNLTVWNNMKLVKNNKKDIESLLKRFDILDKKDSFPDNLSGGQKQRLAIARALLLSPKILLIDEATSSLDDKLTHEFMQYMQELNKMEGLTIVLITHETDLVDTYCTDKYTLSQNKS
ncbi:MAG: ATP-binding cassette domain-containing protein [Erysipelothrix sp.]|nr:ATP-binding cassette domain-containing protein [Erysipelothrix sp.]